LGNCQVHDEGADGAGPPKIISSHLGKDLGDVTGQALGCALSIRVGGVFDEEREEHEGNPKENRGIRGRRTRFTSNRYSNHPDSIHTTRFNNNKRKDTR
jgi:hypothetical protein